MSLDITYCIMYYIIYGYPNCFDLESRCLVENKGLVKFEWLYHYPDVYSK